MRHIEPRIKQYVPHQFPQVFREDGPNFVEFVKGYYQWLETEGKVIAESRLLADYRDIDDTSDSLLSHWVKKFMYGMPTEKFGDKRFIQKHILDVYRSKGSVAGLKLLFRILYETEADVYIPSVDMLKTNDGTWKQPRYLEVEYMPHNELMLGQRIYGADSEATALVEDYVKRVIRGRAVYLLYLSNITGTFSIGEPVYSSLVSIQQGPRILGSPGSINVTFGNFDISVGNRFEAGIANGHGSGLAIKAKRVGSFSSGFVTFELIDGGSGYTEDAVIDVFSGALLTEDGSIFITEDAEFLDVVIEGTGASASATVTINNTFSYSDVLILPYENDLFLDNTFVTQATLLVEAGDSTLFTEDGFALVTSSLGANNNENELISLWEEPTELPTGYVSAVVTLAAGNGYVDDVTVVVTDPFMMTQGLYDSDGLLGFNANVFGAVQFGSNVLTQAVVYDSGFGYLNNEFIEFTRFVADDIQTENGLTLSTEDDIDLVYGDGETVSVEGTITLNSVGHGIGDWTTTRGFLNSDKYLQDSYYYQEYSYDVISPMSLYVYDKTLHKVYHPVGVELFGTASLAITPNDDHTITTSISQS